MKNIPLTINGKIDRGALPGIDISEQINNQFEAPRNELELKLAEIWQQLLGREKIGINDNFFDLGGHSILAMQVVSAVRRKLKLEAGIKDLFVYPTIKDFYGHLLNEQNNYTNVSPISVVHPRPDNIPLSFGQERLWFIDKLDGSHAYHMPAVLRLKGNVDTTALQRALHTVVDRHEVLRTVIIEKDDQQFQQVMDATKWQMNFIARR